MSRKKSEQPVLQLNAEQTEAVNTREGVWGVVAGPGSGKTEILIRRYRRLIDSGINPQDIVSLTFTSEASRNMRDRALNGKKSIKMANSRPCGFLTLHSLALSFCTIERNSFPFRLAAFPLITDGQAAKFIGEVTRKYKLDFRFFRTWVSLQKRLGLRPDQVKYPDQNYILAYKEYDTKCRQAGVLDFDSLILEMVLLLESNSDVADRWNFRFIQVDEAQDLDELQVRLIKLISAKYNNLYCTGDCNQSIFEFRGATPELFLKLHEHFPTCQYIFMGQNYRSSQNIVNFVKAIAPIKNELLDKMSTANEHGTPPKITSFLSDADETKSVIESIKQAGNNGENTAILARTNRQIRIFEDGLFSANIKYHLLGKAGFYSQPEVRNVLAYVQLSHYPSDTAVFNALRAPFWPSRFIRKKELIETLETQRLQEDTKFDNDLFYQPRTIIQLLTDYRDDNTQQQNAIIGFTNYIRSLSGYKNLPAGQAISGIISSLKVLDYYDEEEEAIDNNPQQNIEELGRIANRFSTIAEFLDHVRKVQNASRVKKGVALGTVHSAKGREWDSVYLVGCSEGMLPHSKGDLAEEERIWFVGCSRAAKSLSISYTGVPSRFLAPFIKKGAEA